MNAQVHDPLGEPADQGAKKKGMRAFLDKVNKTKALNSWLEDTALGDLIAAGQRPDPAIARANARQSAARRATGGTSGAATPRPPQGRTPSGGPASDPPGAADPADNTPPPRETPSDPPRAADPADNTPPRETPSDPPAAPGPADNNPPGFPTPDHPAAPGPAHSIPPPTPAPRRYRPATSMAARRPRARTQPAPPPTHAQPTADPELSAAPSPAQDAESPARTAASTRPDSAPGQPTSTTAAQPNSATAPQPTPATHGKPATPTAAESQPTPAPAGPTAAEPQPTPAPAEPPPAATQPPPAVPGAMKPAPSPAGPATSPRASGIPPRESAPAAGAGEPAAQARPAGTEPSSPWPNLRKRSSLPADAAAAEAGETDVSSTQPIEAVTEEAAGTEPSGPHYPGTGRARARRPLTGAPLSGAPVMSWRPRLNPRLRADPRLRVWVLRAIIMLLLFAGFTVWRDWRYGVTAATIYAVADLVYRSKTTAPVPAAARVTSAQRYTRRRLKVLQPAGYLALHARAIPGTDHVIDHVVVGPAGVFTLDSQRLDRRLPLRAIGGMLYHGRTSMEGRLDHAKDESRMAAKLIADELGRRVRVKPAMVMYGPSISWVIMPVKGVDVFDGSRIGTYFRRQTKLAAQYKLTSGQIAMVFAAAARALPPIN